VITTGRGLVPASTPITLTDLAFFAGIRIDLREPRYRAPLEEAVRTLAGRMPLDTQVVLLGSISSSKYVELLLEILGDRLCFPEEFVGMGDMRRGSVMLRAASEGRELVYVRAAGALRSRARSESTVSPVEGSSPPRASAAQALAYVIQKSRNR
jgi:hypothetical protein